MYVDIKGNVCKVYGLKGNCTVIYAPSITDSFM